MNDPTSSRKITTRSVPLEPTSNSFAAASPAISSVPAASHPATSPDAPTVLPPVCILAGGRSSRFPGDKALVPIDGQPQLLQLHQQFQRQNYSVHVVADRQDRYHPIGIDCLVDAYADSGPMAGLITGLEARLKHQGPGWLLAVGCDQLIWRTEWLMGMRPLNAETSEENWLIALWQSCHEKRPGTPITPIPGLYHTGILPQLHERCRSGQLSLRSLLQLSAADFVYYDSTLERHPAWFAFNTPAQLHRLLSS
jgi:molybdopterin-guanine dinucleotide biosynthesis protein A